MTHTWSTDEIRASFSRDYLDADEANIAFQSWLTEHDRQVAEAAWDEGFNNGFDQVLVEKAVLHTDIDFRENPYTPQPTEGES